MSPLWPESISVGLFPGHCWLRRGALDIAPPVAMANAASPDDWLAALGAMLSGLAGTIRRGARVHVLVSDQIAALALLPWQDELSSPAEWLAYAHACFERQGVAIEQGWIAHTEFRDHRAAGIAYAVRGAWLRALIALVEGCGLRLGTVLPVAACVYLAHRPQEKSAQAVVLLLEPHRATALLYRRGSLTGIDVEPAMQDGATALRRLLLRVGAGHGEVSGVDLWSPTADGLRQASDVVGACVPKALLRPLERDIWS